MFGYICMGFILHLTHPLAHTLSLTYLQYAYMIWYKFTLIELSFSLLLNLTCRMTKELLMKSTWMCLPWKKQTEMWSGINKYGYFYPSSQRGNSLLWARLLHFVVVAKIRTSKHTLAVTSYGLPCPEYSKLVLMDWHYMWQSLPAGKLTPPQSSWIEIFFNHSHSAFLLSIH